MTIIIVRRVLSEMELEKIYGMPKSMYLVLFGCSAVGGGDTGRCIGDISQ
jgi:hypothetical protein